MARAELAGSLAAIPDGAGVLIDGLVGCSAPDVVVPHMARLRAAVLVHLPLADEKGLLPTVAADLDTREQETLRAATAVVATSPWAARRLVDHHNLDAHRVHTAAPGTDAAPLAPGTDGASRLLCVAAVTPTKGHDLLVEALAAIRELPWSCVCAGALHRDPEYVSQIRDAIRKSGLDDRVHLVGPRTGDQLAATYAAADLLVLASRAETYGMVVPEALARGIPVLATTAGGVPETVGHAPDGNLPGLLVPPDDPTALAEALRRWLGEHEVRRRVKISASQRRGMLDGWAETSRKLAGVLEQLRQDCPGTA
jgi:glycosyltransferase involved in cell wall biosynthesis